MTGGDSIAPTVVPKRVACDVTKLSLGRLESFVLSQVDGRLSLDDLAAVVGLSFEEVQPIVAHLQALGAVTLPGATEPEETGDARPSRSRERAAVSVEVFSTAHDRRKAAARGHAPTAASPFSRSATSPRPTAHASAHSSAPSSAPSLRSSTEPPAGRAPEEHDEACELDAATQARVNELHAKLGAANHYEILEVARDVDQKALKRAYFGFAATLHPDRHFRKNLGPLKEKLNELFDRMTLAYETLNRPSVRATYDYSLGVRPRAVTALPSQPPPSMNAPPPYRPPSINAPPLHRPLSSIPPPPSRPGSIRPEAPRARIRIRHDDDETAGAAPMIPVSVSAEAAERSAASALGAANPAPRAARVAGEAPGVESVHALRRFFAEKVDEETRQHARVFTEAGEYELAKGNVIGAATQFQFALNCCDAPELRRAFEAVEGLAQVRRFELQHGRAVAAEREGQWEAAVDGYTRAHAAKPEGRVAERLANAIRLAKGDLRQAAKLGEEAVQQEPENAAYRVTLGEVYADAGLELRAVSEAKRAIAIAPSDPRAQELMARLSAAKPT